MPSAGETLVHQPHTSHVNPGLRYLYERAKSGALPTINTNAALSRAAQEKAAKYPHVKRVGPYLLGKTIGEGSFAKVKEALHSVVGEKVAIKIIDKKVVREDPYLRKNMRREACLLQSLHHHPNIITLYEVMETDNNFYMILELCSGGALLDRICSEKCLMEREARRYVRQIVSAVDHLHQAGIIHRDLKVENLLLDGNNNIKIIDFGLSNLVGIGHMRAEFRATQCGSPAYAAPEIIANKRYGAKVDVWSIGVNTFAMLAGCLPFTVEPFNIKLLLKKINNREMAEIPTHLSNDCKDFIKKLLHPDPRMRYSVTETLNHRWLAVEKDAPHRPRTASPPPNGRVSRMELETDILEYIWSNMGYNINHVTNSVISKRADEYSAIYYLLLRKRNRQHLKMLRKIQVDDEEGKKDAKDTWISGPKLYEEAAAVELAGRKNGSLHFQMALLLEQAKEEDAPTRQRSNNEKTEETQIHPNDLKSSDEPMKSKKYVTSLSENYKEGTFSSSKDSNKQMRVFRKQVTGTTNHKKHQRLSFQSDTDKLIKTSANFAQQIQEECKETSNKVHGKKSDMRLNTRGLATGHRLSTAHTVNLTFKQSDIPSKNFAGHFNYRRGNRQTLVLAPTRIVNEVSNGKVVDISTWKQADSIDKVYLKNHMNGLRISTKLGEKSKDHEICEIQPSTQIYKDTILKHENNSDTQYPLPKDLKILDERRQLKISKRKSIYNPPMGIRRSSRTRKRAGSDAKLVARLPGRPPTPVASEFKAETKRKVTEAVTNDKERHSWDKTRGSKRKKSVFRKTYTLKEGDGGHEKSEVDPAANEDLQLVSPKQAVLQAATPLTKKLSQKTQPPKGRLTNKRVVCNEVTAETLV
ncbi:hormonally up-regulated neu tumor-associated kinase homolog B-like [Acanthaster planci]|uniref:non-specific serine/threonine protein kinase n=1 Tax=Acanthaster planci TaxID=133434 RepID=A0A8B7YY09_ACAPL|nr:hormonally up-regulated neu tumor-associated kinase homolog B-like [Acanthaster planci]